MSSFELIVDSYSNFNIEEYCKSITVDKVDRALSKKSLTPEDFLTLISPAADLRLEEMASKASLLTLHHFGRATVLFTPLYISNYCDNICPYCSFSKRHQITRIHLTFEQIEEEAKRISETGIRHILLLTGESRSKTPIDYIEKSVVILKKYFSSIAIEIYPLTEDEYKRLIKAGVDMLTIYQETYNKEKYLKLHKGGPKADYTFRLEAPERACRAGIRAVGIGALYGLYKWEYDAFFTALHASFLQKKFPSVEFSLSLPRLRPIVTEFESNYSIDNKTFVKIMMAFRIFLPSVGITISTRESADFRMAILPLGVTRMSAGVSTAVGGHSGNSSTPQFEIADTRDVDTIKRELLKRGFQPVMHDWNFSLSER